MGKIKQLIMRFLFIILLFSLNASATNYYVSNTGSDAANGLTPGTAWQTIAKVNSINFSAGDSILFKRGDSWREALRPHNSGTAGNNIIYSAYGTGARPIFTGFQTVSLNDSSGFYNALVPQSVTSLNTVKIGGVLRAKGRYPNSTFLLANTGANTQSSIVATGLGGNHVGAELVTKGHNWILDVNRISFQSGDTLNVTVPFSYGDYPFYKYFIQNELSVLDLANEWYFDSTNKKLYVYNPSGVVEISTIDTLIAFKNTSYLTFDNLTLMGANNVGISLDTSATGLSSNYIKIQNCTLKETGGWNPKPLTSGGMGGAAVRGEKSVGIEFKKDSLLNNLSDAIFLIHRSDYAIVDSTYINNTGIYMGMGSSSNGSYTAIYIDGVAPTITNNKIDSTGYTAVYWEGINGRINHNNINYYCFRKDDGGGIYTYGGTAAGSIVKSNIIRNGIGLDWVAAGVYLDNSTQYVVVDSNTIETAKIGGILFTTPSSNKIRWNTVVNGTGAGFYHSIGGGGSDTMYRNIFYSTDSTQYVYDNYYPGLIGMKLDSNYWLRPLKENGKFHIEASNNGQPKSFNLAEFRAETGYELNGMETPSGITAAPGILHFNATLEPVTKTFAGRYIDAKGASYTNSIVLQPFSSSLLFYAIDQSVVFSGSRKLIGLKYKAVKNL